MITWADKYIEELKNTGTVTMRVSGPSMEPLIQSKALCTLVVQEFKLGDVVLVTTGVNAYLHRIGAETWIGPDRWLRIENAAGRSNGWVPAASVYGVLVKVET